MASDPVDQFIHGDSSGSGVSSMQKYHDDEPRIRLKEGLDMSAFQRGEGLTFDVSGDQIEIEMDEIDDNKRQMGLGYRPSNNDDDDEEEDADARVTFDTLRPTMTDLTNGESEVLKRIVKEGYGEIIPPTSRVTFHAIGRLDSEVESFDNSYLRKKPFRLTVGDGETIDGLELGLTTMKKGEIAQFLIEPSYAYSLMGIPPRIPANATVLFRVELLEAVKVKDSVDVGDVPRAERTNVPIAKVLKVCSAQREVGNKEFKRSNFGAASRRYDKAIHLLEEWPIPDEPTEKQVHAQLIKLYLNLANAKFRLGKYPQVITCSRRALDINPDNAKAYYYMGLARAALQDWVLAHREYSKAIKLKPGDKGVLAAMQRAKVDEKEANRLHKEFCSKMFTADKKSKSSPPEPNIPIVPPAAAPVLPAAPPPRLAVSNVIHSQLSENIASGKGVSPAFIGEIREEMMAVVNGEKGDHPLEFYAADYSEAEMTVILEECGLLGLNSLIDGEGEQDCLLVFKKPEEDTGEDGGT